MMARHYELAMITTFLLAAGCGERTPVRSAGDAGHASVAAGARATPSTRPATAAHFVDRAEAAGVRFIHRNGEDAGHVSILESLGGGVAMLDYDADGNVDLMYPGGGYYAADHRVLGLPNGLFRNDSDWQFSDVSIASGLAVANHYSHGACAADFDADGFTDVVVTGYGGVTLFQNQGDGTFLDVTAQSGIDDQLWSTSGAWGDINGDGHLDLYLVHYVDWSFENHPFCSGPEPGLRETCPPREFKAQPDTLLHNNGDGTFEDISTRIGLRTDGNGLGVLMGDVDLDGDLDIYVANDSTRNFLYLNDGRGILTEFGLPSGTALGEGGIPDGSMGVDLGDFDRDGRPDLWVANFEGESFALYRNLGEGVFRSYSRQAGIVATHGLFVGWGTAFFDFDGDQDEDIFVANGHVVRYPKNAPLRQTSLLFENQDGKSFVDVAASAGEYTAAAHMARGVAVGDLDNDGDLDVAISQINEPVALLENRTASHNHWLALKLIGRQSNRDAIGAWVRITTADGQQTRQIKGGTSYASTSDTRVYFGLGVREHIEKIEIRWPRGTRQVVENVSADQQVVLHEPDAM